MSKIACELYVKEICLKVTTLSVFIYIVQEENIIEIWYLKAYVAHISFAYKFYEILLNFSNLNELDLCQEQSAENSLILDLNIRSE